MYDLVRWPSRATCSCTEGRLMQAQVQEDLRCKRSAAWSTVAFEGEAGFSKTPPTAHTWSRRGHTPVVRVRGCSWRRWSIAAMCCHRPGEPSRLIYRPRRHRKYRGKGCFIPHPSDRTRTSATLDRPRPSRDELPNDPCCLWSLRAVSRRHESDGVDGQRRSFDSGQRSQQRCLAVPSGGESGQQDEHGVESGGRELL